jgi:hypothetical protein
MDTRCAPLAEHVRDDVSSTIVRALAEALAADVRRQLEAEGATVSSRRGTVRSPQEVVQMEVVRSAGVRRGGARAPA